ncbi:uncharacterized protein LOC131190636 [Ahaetulla prasina]|uniref:uncharacterized protein LOC131190636 n=1 Tax=Ahaetulla prasina TaxID=499056 RepID=UPI00264850C9|nr:uncharacterized protein LOC131190636 [Ahaetulla prasina]
MGFIDKVAKQKFHPGRLPRWRFIFLSPSRSQQDAFDHIEGGKKARRGAGEAPSVWRLQRPCGQRKAKVLGEAPRGGPPNGRFLPLKRKVHFLRASGACKTRAACRSRSALCAVGDLLAADFSHAWDRLVATLPSNTRDARAGRSGKGCRSCAGNKKPHPPPKFPEPLISGPRPWEHLHRRQLEVASRFSNTHSNIQNGENLDSVRGKNVAMTKQSKQTFSTFSLAQFLLTPITYIRHSTNEPAMTMMI